MKRTVACVLVQRASMTRNVNTRTKMNLNTNTGTNMNMETGINRYIRTAFTIAKGYIIYEYV